MSVGVYFCRCGCGLEGQVSAKIDPEAVRALIEPLPQVAYYEVVDFSCADSGQEQIAEHLRATMPDQVVIAACSPRQHEDTFKGVLSRAGMNPYLLQMVNVREQVAWVTEDRDKAVVKAADQIRAGIARVAHHRPLAQSELDVCADVMVIGGGPAGLRAALTAAEAGRKVILVERQSILGGLPVRIEDIFPSMECAPCLLEPIIGSVLHNELPGKIELRLNSEVTAVKGFLGNFTVTVRTEATHVDVGTCVGCGMCVEECPASGPNQLNLGRTERKAIDFELFGGLPSVPVLDESLCTRFTEAAACTTCVETCPVEGAIRFEQVAEVAQNQVGAIVVAVGAATYDLSAVPRLGYGTHPDVLCSWDLERIMAANGPTGGTLLTSAGEPPAKVAIVHCAGSMDTEHVPYCSSICCQNAFKYAHLIGKQLPGTTVSSYLRTVVAPGKEGYSCMLAAFEPVTATQHWYSAPEQIEVRTDTARPTVVLHRPDGAAPTVEEFDLVVLLEPVVPAAGLAELARTLDITLDGTGFLEERNARSEATSSRVRGIAIAGACQSPTDIAGAMTQGAAAAAQALSQLVEGRKLVVDPAVAVVDQGRCSACRTCVPVCPYQAIDMAGDNGRAVVNPVLCTGCGTCVAACPAGAIEGRHSTDRAILAEIEAVLL